MKIVTFTLSYWDNEAAYTALRDELNFWSSSMDKFLQPFGKFIACGTWSDPSYASDLTVLNAGVTKTYRYCPYRWNYAMCAETYGMYYALMNYDFDILAQICTDSLINCDIRALCADFLATDKLVMAGPWHDGIEDAFIFYKKEAVLRYLNGRLRANLIAPDTLSTPIGAEHEKAAIFNGLVYNPFGEAVRNHRVEDNIGTSSAISGNWHFYIRPTQGILNWYYNKYNIDGVRFPKMYRSIAG